MAADVLLYNALNEVNRCLITQNATLDTNIAAQNALCTTAQNTINTNAPALVAEAGPNQANMWCLIPTLPATGCPWTTGFKVCDTSGYFRCGNCCAWTVPAGVTCARFQIWGAGAGSGYGCCCGFSPFGGTGAYASVIIPVTAGDVYTLCSGCAYCCYACRASHYASGCASYVTGTNLTNFCAQGGEGSKWCEVRTRCICAAMTSTHCRYLGGSICNYGSDICWDSTTGQNSTQSGVGAPGCCFDNMWPMISSCKTYFGSATGGTVYGIRGGFGSIAVNCNGAICVQHPPIYGFASSSCCASLLIGQSNGAGCYYSAASGYLNVPGAGGWANIHCGGGTNYYSGDAGRMGMVCVSYR